MSNQAITQWTTLKLRFLNKIIEIGSHTNFVRSSRTKIITVTNKTKIPLYLKLTYRS